MTDPRLLALLMLVACAPDLAHHHDAAMMHMCSEPAGFWLGWWHGLIVPFTALGQLLGFSVTIYETCNTGGWYVFGFVLGVGAFTRGAR